MKLTPLTVAAFRHAQSEAEKGDHSCIGSQHLLLGLYLTGDGLAASALKSAGLAQEKIRDGINHVGPVPEEFHLVDEFLCGTSVVQALERITQGTNNPAQAYINTEQLLLAILLESSGPTVRLVTDLKLEMPTVRQQVMDHLASMW